MSDYSKYLIPHTATIREALVALNDLSHDVLVLFVMNEFDQMVGTLTDGDIRRYLIGGGEIKDCVCGAMTRSFLFRTEDSPFSTIKEYKDRGISLVLAWMGRRGY